MSNLPRREFLAGAGLAAAAAAAMASKGAAAGDPSFLNNVPDTVLDGDQLRTVRF